MFLKKRFSTIRYFSKNLVLILIFQGITTLQAQQSNPISLQEAIKIAKENNKNILKSRIEIDISKENIKETKELRLPEIDFNTSYSRITNLTEFKSGFLKDKEVTHTIPEMYNVGTAIKVPLYVGNKINNAIKIAKQENAIALVKSEKTESDIELEVIATYLGIQKMMELQKIIEENIKEEQSRLKEVQSLKNHGTITKNEVLRAELQLSDRELNSLTNSKNIKIALNELKTILQLPEEEVIAIDEATSLNENAKLDDYSFYLSNTLQNEEMRIAYQEIEIKKTEVKLAKGNYYPKINFFGDYNFKYPNYMFFPPNPYLYSLGQVGIEASFSLSGLYKNKTKVHIANSKVELQKTQSEIVKNKVQDELFKNHTQYQEIVEKIVVVDKALELATENYRIVKLKYLNQLVLITEMVDADNALLQAKFNKIATRIDAEMKHYELLHTAGLLNK
ncbi:TolC family protein [Flavobacterium branchiarum]|uniref:TolC family protein n=1 Tax=Flavobacterium branchiarum TaxID=1114870 RepID=A0ABV5FRD1_9FLAO|nr:TolC family protein [Flavobacterium branchiarum]MDN3671531.1 TolC family protein [Flavobacterium branchiarum]